MRETYSREYYKNKFNNFCYVKQPGEEIKQCVEPLPSYYFISNKGYLMSVYGKNVRIIKPEYDEQKSRWSYKIRGKRYSLHRLVGLYFLQPDVLKPGEEYDVHHIKKCRQFSKHEPQKANCVDNLQILPKSVHKQVTLVGNHTQAELDAKIKVTEDGFDLIGVCRKSDLKLLIDALMSKDAYIIMDNQAEKVEEKEVSAYTMPNDCFENGKHYTLIQ